MRYILILLGLLSTVCYASPNEDDHITNQLLQNSDASTKIYKEIINSTPRRTTQVLFVAAAKACKDNNIKEAAYLYYIALFRAEYDKNLFPPKGTGGNSPMLVFGALQATISPQILPEITKHPEDFTEVVDMVSKWVPELPDGYNPGWEYTDKGNQEECLSLIKARIAEFKKAQGGFATLLNQPDYFKAFRTFQDYNMVFDETRPSEEDKNKAIEIMTEIEQKLDIEGAFYKRNK